MEFNATKINLFRRYLFLELFDLKSFWLKEQSGRRPVFVYDLLHTIHSF